MSGPMSMQLSGVKELQAALAALPGATPKNVVRRALKKAAQPVADKANELAPVGKTGALKGSFTVTPSIIPTQRREVRRPEALEARMFIGANYKLGGSHYAPHAHLVEFGTGPRYHAESGKYVGQMPAHPILRPAWDAYKQTVVVTFGNLLGPEIEKSAERLRKKAARA